MQVQACSSPPPPPPIVFLDETLYTVSVYKFYSSVCFFGIVFVIDKVFCLQVVGIKGATVLSLHRPYDISKVIVLQAILLGVALDLLCFWFDKKHKTDVQHVKSLILWQTTECSEVLLQIQVPDTISRALFLCLFEIWKSKSSRLA